MPGPAPKSDVERARRNTPVKAEIDVMVVRAVEAGLVPDHPRGLSRQLQEEWDEFWLSPLAGVIASTDLPALRRLWKLRQRQADYLELLDDGLLAEGSKEQLVVNPALGAAMALEKAISNLEDRFAQTVKARQNTGIRMGALADVETRHPGLLTKEPTPRADPRLADTEPAPAD